MEIEKGKEVEVSNKEGYEGTLFVASVIRPSLVNKNMILVEYLALIDEEENVPLQGYVKISNLRPIPPTQKTRIFKLNEEVDAFFCSGWWKGVIIKVLEDSKYTVYIKSTKEEIDFQNWELRTHREWVGGRWVSSQDQNMTVIEHNEESSRFLNPAAAGSPAPNIDKVTQPSPSESMDNLLENIVFTTDEEPSTNEPHSSSDPALTSQELSSISKATDEFVRPSKDTREGEATDLTLSLKRCHALGASKGSSVEVQRVLPFSTGKGESSPAKESTIKEMSQMTNVQTEHTQVLSYIVEEDQTLSMLSKKTNIPIAKDNGGTENGNTNNDLNRSQFSSPTMEELQTPSLVLEQSNHPTAEDNDTQVLANETITSKDNSSKSFKGPEFRFEARGDERVLQSSVNDTANAHSSPMQLDGGSLPKESLPFIKSSNVWETFESMRVFRLVPQCPHFQPLEKENELLREGTALGKMFSFANLMESICKADIDEPRSAFENKLKVLPDMEQHGFTIQPLQSRLEKILSMKDRHSQLEDSSNIAKRKISDAVHQLDEIEGSIFRGNMELQELLTKMETRDSKVAKLQKTRDAILEMKQKAKTDFERKVAAFGSRNLQCDGVEVQGLAISGQKAAGNRDLREVLIVQ
ncbi:hypothetical protein AQUCO_03000351v1 [Aquilegia coerulea]|uniref:Agenet domain-containing protein n=1 Tax=Aquilegia coerulea TaxID=218851 RepID=A0A2G5D2N0_AQUCA|nr:hypothetical protein AQUCO_03000351v1 [Aquilegia coerulea]